MPLSHLVNIKRFLLLLMLGSACLASAYAQVKFERESRVNFSEVPQAARSFVDSCCPGQKKIKWYREESQDGLSFEAKFQDWRGRYSIEFDSLGQVWDVEKKVKLRKLPLAIKANILRPLDSLYDSYRITKLQLQWSSPREDLAQSAKAEDSSAQAYEIVLRTHETEGGSLFQRNPLESLRRGTQKFKNHRQND
jgi:hypothetical protein